MKSNSEVLLVMPTGCYDIEVLILLDSKADPG